MAAAPASETEKSVAALDKTRFADGATPVAELRLKLQKEMQDHAAVYRTQDTLAEGVVIYIYMCIGEGGVVRVGFEGVDMTYVCCWDVFSTWY